MNYITDFASNRPGAATMITVGIPVLAFLIILLINTMKNVVDDMFRLTIVGKLFRIGKFGIDVLILIILGVIVYGIGLMINSACTVMGKPGG